MRFFFTSTDYSAARAFPGHERVKWSSEKGDKYADLGTPRQSLCLGAQERSDCLSLRLESNEHSPLRLRLY
jgi:hypothetical protein